MKKTMLFIFGVVLGLAAGSIAGEVKSEFNVTVALRSGESIEVALDNSAALNPVFTFGFNPIALKNIRTVKPLSESKQFINPEGDVYSKQKFEITLRSGKKYIVTAKNFDAWFENSTGLAWEKAGIELSSIEFKNSGQMTAIR